MDDSVNLSRKVVAVSAGEAHTLALTGDGSVYSWGRGMFGRLGTGSEADEPIPVRVNFDCAGRSTEERLRFVGVAAGAYHSLALADDGSIWCWGYNICILCAGLYSVTAFGYVTEHRYGNCISNVHFLCFFSSWAHFLYILDYYMDGQLGIDGDNATVPHLLRHFIELASSDSLADESETKSRVPLKVCSVKAGGMMSLAIDNLGALWMWGNCPQQSSSSEGGFFLVSSFIPTPVWDFHGHTVIKVACGNEHVVALVSAGETYKGEDIVCYSWGNNNHGQLGLGDKESRLRPEIIKTFNEDSPWAVYEVACGAFHTALLTHKKKPSDTLESLCWTFGIGDNGQLGHETTQCELFPKPVKGLPQNVYLISVDCGLFHTSVVSSAGDVWSWGMERGLGLCPDATFSGTDRGDALSPLLISCNGLQRPKFQDPVQVACGAAHTVLVAHDGYKLWSWGRGKSGVLGNGNTAHCFTPTMVLWPPLMEDSKQEELKTSGEEDNVGAKDSEGVTETERRLSLAMDEMKLLQSKLSAMERYVSVLHGSIFGKPFEEEDIPASLQNFGTFDIAKEWENMLEAADRSKLIRLEMSYRNMLAGVKDKLMKRRIQEIVEECLHSSSTGPK